MSCLRVFAVLFLSLSLLLRSRANAASDHAASNFSRPQTTVPPAANATSPGTAPSAAKDDGQAQTFHTQINEVNVIFTVLDKHNKFVKDLKQNEFKILDNNRPPKQVMNFAAETDLPLRVGLLIDASNSIRDRFLFEQQAAIEFLHQIIRPQSDKAFVLAFDEVWDETQPFTNDLDKLTRGVKVIRPGGGTALWDAVYHACKETLMKERETGLYARRSSWSLTAMTTRAAYCARKRLKWPARRRDRIRHQHQPEQYSR